MRKILCCIWAFLLLPPVGAWQDAALSALAERVVNPAQLYPLRMLQLPPKVKAPVSLAELPADHPLMEGFALWQQEMPELLRRTAESGDATLRSPHGFTALQAACLAGEPALIRELVQAGAPAEARPAEREKMGLVGEAPLSLLTANAHLTVEQMLPSARLLLEHGADPDAPVLFCSWGGIGERYIYKKRYCALLFGDGRAWQPRHDHLKLDLLLLAFGEQNYAKRFLPEGELFIPWWLLNTSVSCRLLEGGAAVDALPRKEGIIVERAKIPTLNHLAYRGDVEGVRLALEKGASLGKTLLFWIRTQAVPAHDAAPDEVPYTPERALEMARLLLEHGADPHVRNRLGETLAEAYGKQPGPIAAALSAFFRDKESE